MRLQYACARQCFRFARSGKKQTFFSSVYLQLYHPFLPFSRQIHRNTVYLTLIINFYAMTEDRISDGSPGHMSRPEADATPLTGLLQGLPASIAQLTQASLSQTEAFKNLKEDPLLLPDPQDERSHEDEPYQDAVDPTAPVNALLDTNKGAHVAKSADGQDQRSTTEQDIIDSLTQALTSKPKKSPPIDAKIASLVDDILIADMAREKGEKYSPPENCKHLQAITINEEIWDLMSRKNKSIDLAFQKVLEPLVEGLSALAILSDGLVKDVQSSRTANTREDLNQVMDAIVILGNANWRLNMKRREIIKPELNPPYTRLCEEEITPSQKLFGDDLSKHPKEMTDAVPTEWSLCTQVFEDIQKLWGKSDVDFFASRLNFKIPSYVSWRPDLNAMFVNALYMNWHNYSFYAFPPFSLIGTCLQKIQQDRATGVVIVPLWPTQPRFIVLLYLLTDNPRILPCSKTLLTKSHNGALHPLRDQLRLMACKRSGESSNREAFQAKLPISSSNLGLLEPRNNINHISRSGLNLVMEGRAIHMIHL